MKVHKSGITTLNDNSRLITIRAARSLFRGLPDYARFEALPKRPGVWALPPTRWFKNGVWSYRDSRRQRCYDMEKVLWGRDDFEVVVFTNLDDAARFLRDTIETKWFQRRWPLFRSVKLRSVHQLQGGANASGLEHAWWSERRPEGDVLHGHIPKAGRIHVAASFFGNCSLLHHCSDMLLLHELAHCICQPWVMHHRQWLRSYMELVKYRKGREFYKIMAEECRSAKLRYNPYRQVKLSPGHLEKLAAARVPGFQKKEDTDERRPR